MKGRKFYTAILAFSLPLIGALQALAQGGSLVGTVRDHLGKPKANMMVIAQGPPGQQTSQTDEQGNYALKELKAGQYVAGAVQIIEMKWLGATSTDMHFVRIENDKESRLDIVVGGPRKVYGKVTLKGKPQEGLVVSIQYPVKRIMATKTSRTASDTTDKSGQYEIENVQPGQYMLSVVKVDSMTQHSRLFETEIQLTNENLQKDIKLPEGKISGRVLDAGTLQPIEGARVTLERKQAGTVQEAALQKMGSYTVGGESTDAEGKYSFSIVEDDVYNVVGSKEGYAPQGLTAAVENSKGPASLDFSLASGEPISGRVMWSDPSRPVRQIFLTARDSSGRAVYLKKIGLSEAGEYETEELSPGEYAISVDAKGYASATKKVKVRAGPENKADFGLTPGGTLLIKAIDDKGSPIPGIFVELIDEQGDFFIGFFPDTKELMKLGFEAILREDGVDVSHNLPEGKYRAKVGALDYEDQHVTVSVHEAEQTERTVTLRRSR